MKHPIYLTILLLLTAIVVALPFIKVPISVSARGVIRSNFEDSELTAPVSGRVVKCFLSQNNQSIQKGDTLLVITTELLDTQRQLVNTQQQDYNAQLQDLTTLVSHKNTLLQTQQYAQERAAFLERIGQLQAQLSLAKKELDRANQLFSKDVIAKAEYEKIYYRHEELLRQMQSTQQQQYAQWQAQRTEVERKLQSLQSDEKRISQEQQNYVIIAPITGKITQYKGVRLGNFLSQGQAVATISSEQNLIAECLVSPKDIGFIYPSQNVRFQIDTYNYNQWGLLNGSVKEIDKNLVVNEQTGEGLFKIRCGVSQNHLELKNGYRGNIGKGMSFTARFYLTNRTLWQLLFDRADDWFNPNLT